MSNCAGCGRVFEKYERRVRDSGSCFCRSCRPLGPPPMIRTYTVPSPPSEVARVYALKQSRVDEVMAVLQACAKDAVLTKINYQKPLEAWVSERLVEPYSISHTDENLIVQCWQISPSLDDPCWRSFRVDRIVAAEPTVITYSPRRKITIHMGEITRFSFHDSLRGSEKETPSPQQIYSETLRKKLVSMELSDADISDLTNLSKSLPAGQMRAIHGRLYVDVLMEVCADGRITDGEIDRLTTLRVWLTSLGWSP